jgi:hypothetical protein
VPIDAVPDNAAITTESIDWILGASGTVSSAMAGSARKLSDRTLTTQLVGFVRYEVAA